MNFGFYLFVVIFTAIEKQDTGVKKNNNNEMFWTYWSGDACDQESIAVWEPDVNLSSGERGNLEIKCKDNQQAEGI